MNLAVIGRLAYYAGAALATFITARAAVDALVEVLQAPPLFDRASSVITIVCPNGHPRLIGDGQTVADCYFCSVERSGAPASEPNA